MEQQNDEVLAVARELFKQSPDWRTFFHEIFGAGGAVGTVFRTQEERNVFEKTAQYKEIREMLDSLNDEQTATMTVKMSKRQHRQLQAESNKNYTSMNKLAVAKLRLPVDIDNVGPVIEEKGISIRLPKSLHQGLKKEATDNHTTLKRLAVAKLLKPIDPLLVKQE